MPINILKNWLCIVNNHTHSVKITNIYEHLLLNYNKISKIVRGEIVINRYIKVKYAIL